MTQAMLESLIPIIAILATFGSPVAVLFVWKWFKFKDKELLADLEIRRSAGIALESRVQRLESIILALDADVRAAATGHQLEAPAQTEEPRVPERLRTVGPRGQ